MSSSWMMARMPVGFTHDPALRVGPRGGPAHLTVHDLLDEPACSQSSLSRRAHNDDRALPALSADRVLAVFCTIWSMVQEMMRIGLL